MSYQYFSIVLFANRKLVRHRIHKYSLKFLNLPPNHEALRFSNNNSIIIEIICDPDFLKITHYIIVNITNIIVINIELFTNCAVCT